MKKLTCGFIIRTERGILACHPTGKKYGEGAYDIPKGQCEACETPLMAACRELEEETGLRYQDLHCKYTVNLGIMPYRKGKDIQLYFIDVVDFPFDYELNCRSTFIDSKGQEQKEMDGYKWTWNVIDFYPSLQTRFMAANQEYNIFNPDAVKDRIKKTIEVKHLESGLYRHNKSGKYYWLEQPSVFVKEEDDEWNRDQYLLYKALYDNEDGPYFVRTVYSFMENFSKVEEKEDK